MRDGLGGTLGKGTYCTGGAAGCRIAFFGRRVPGYGIGRGLLGDHLPAATAADVDGEKTGGIVKMRAVVGAAGGPAADHEGGEHGTGTAGEVAIDADGVLVARGMVPVAVLGLVGGEDCGAAGHGAVRLDAHVVLGHQFSERPKIACKVGGGPPLLDGKNFGREGGPQAGCVVHQSILLVVGAFLCLDLH